MLDLDLVSHARLQVVKRLRRFSASLISDRDMSDAAVMEALGEAKQTSDWGDHGYAAMLRIIIEIASRSAQGKSSILLMRPELQDYVPTYVKFQSLAHESRAVMSLYLIEQYSCEDIADLMSANRARVAAIIEECSQYLSTSEPDSSLDAAIECRQNNG